MISYDRNWNHKEIIEFINEKKDFDEEVKKEIERLLKEDWDTWLKKMINDRNLHHEANFGLSEMYIVQGKTFIMLTRSDQTKTSDISGYVDIGWYNILGVVKDMIYLVFCGINPALKGIVLNKEFFIPEETNKESAKE